MSDVLVLCYHGISDRWRTTYSVTPAALEQQLTHLLRRGFHGTTFREALAGVPAGKTLAVTFDDSYETTFTMAFPILAALGLPATVFVPTAFSGARAPMSWEGIDHWVGGPHESELLPMSWEQLARLGQAGWEVGSHTRTHRLLTELDQESLEFELSESRRACEERLDLPCDSLAYPYGNVNDRVVEAARAAGYRQAAALSTRFHQGLPLQWPRVGIYQRDDLRRFRVKTARATRRLRSSPAWDVLDRTRRVAWKR